MQAIWSYEHPDQRFFRLFNTKVPQLTAPAARYNLRIKTAPAPSAPLDAVVNLDREGAARKVRHIFYCRPIIDVEEKTLAEVAELDNLLGFKGNYMIFPLRKSNVLTDFMMAPYVDSEFGLLDPDAPGNWSFEEFAQLYCCLKKELGDRFSEVEPALKEFYKRLLLDLWSNLTRRRRFEKPSPSLHAGEMCLRKCLFHVHLVSPSGMVETPRLAGEV